MKFIIHAIIMSLYSIVLCPLRGSGDYLTEIIAPAQDQGPYQ